MLIQGKKCLNTLFFSSESTDNKTYEKYEIRKIILKNKNFFISFFENEQVFQQHIKLLEKNGLFKSRYEFGINNLFLCKKKFAKNTEKNYNLYKYQKVYRYLNAFKVFKKDSLYKSYYFMKKLFFADFNYMPETYNFPEQKYLIERKFGNYKINLSNLWLVKPSGLYGGNGIGFLSSLKNIKMKKYVITKYINNIDLIKLRKYDLRLYVLITGLKPLRIYLYKEGLVRIASEKFFINNHSISNKYIHLTNTDVNMFNKRYMRPKSSLDENANTWNLFMYKSFLKKKGIEWEIIEDKIKDIIIKSIISIQEQLIKENEKLNFDDQSFFNILGFDILITNNFIPKLLEINFEPDLIYRHIIDKPIKSNLFIDTLNLIGIIPFSRKLYKPINNRITFKSGIDEKINNAFCELQRPKGGYKLIFPSKENIKNYKKYFIMNPVENIKFWDKLKSQN